MGERDTRRRDEKDGDCCVEQALGLEQDVARKKVQQDE